MIGKLKGKIDFLGKDFLILDINGVGYKVFVVSEVLRKEASVELALYTYNHVREDILALYGFLSYDELLFFELLLGVSGVGPKMAMNIMSAFSCKKIEDSVLKQDPSLLSSISGVGSKKAEKIVVELKGKIGTLKGTSIFSKIEEQDEILGALERLGYKSAEIKKIIPEIPTNIENTEERIKAALKLIG
ncbi:MAG: Holliday junction branch migration protein RuvA [Patescibacteria group bacterium]|nr:Holliday junction branch migration protein RuvA [Patescibacteria group bacterium]